MVSGSSSIAKMISTQRFLDQNDTLTSLSRCKDPVGLQTLLWLIQALEIAVGCKFADFCNCTCFGCLSYLSEVSP